MSRISVTLQSVNKRFFQLRGKDLHYYKSHEDRFGDIQGSINLRDVVLIASLSPAASAAPDADGECVRGHGFSLVCVERVWDLIAEEDYERDDWLALLRPIVAENGAPPPFEPRIQGSVLKQAGLFNTWQSRCEN